MGVKEKRLTIRPRCILERRWDPVTRPLPRRWVLSEGNDIPATAISPQMTPLDFTTRMKWLCQDVATRCPELSHIDTSAILFSFTAARNRSTYGLQARVTPMRFRDGTLTRRVGGTLYQVQRYYVSGREMLYLVTFCLPRFLDQTFEEKLITVFHELYHISPKFDGDFRRLEGRYAVHSRSKRAYDDRMALLVRRYLADHPDPERYGFLRFRAAKLWRDHGGIVGVSVPRPVMVPIY